MKKRVLFPLLLVVCLLALTGCGGNPLPDGMEEDAVLSAGQEVLELIQAGDYGQVYDRLRQDIRDGVSAQAIQEQFQPILDPAGEFRSVEKTLVTGTQDPEPQGIAVFLCEYSQAEIRFRFAFDPDMELIGLEVQEQ